ncbi:MAG TPA: DUF423 domain-containing protein [Saprospiraceae bacterium]|nr:DUF423 domain-containing protein [Saprospiraceae bacterium]
MTPYQKWTLISVSSGVLAVILGAFGAHSLKPLLSPEQVESFHTASFYHFIHTIVLLIIAITMKNNIHPYLRWAAILIFTGIVFFSGSLYLLASRDVLQMPSWGLFGLITPAGGLFLIVGWMFFGLSVWKTTNTMVK